MGAREPEVGMSFARVDGDGGPTETEVRALMKVLIGVDPHKSSVAVAAIDEAHRRAPRACRLPAEPRRLEGPRTLGETVLRASLGRRERRRPRGRYLAVRLAGSGECVVDVPPKLSARVRVVSSFAGNARKNDGVDALATALAASRNERLAGRR